MAQLILIFNRIGKIIASYYVVQKNSLKNWKTCEKSCEKIHPKVRDSPNKSYLQN